MIKKRFISGMSDEEFRRKVESISKSIMKKDFKFAMKDYYCDMSQAAWVGAIAAVGNYNSAKGEFGAFAYNYIRGAMRQTVQECTGYCSQYYSVWVRKFEDAQDGIKSNQEIAEEMGMSIRTLETVENIIAHRNMSQYDPEWMDYEPTADESNLETVCIKEEFAKILQNALRNLDEVERDVLKMRFCEQLTYKKISEKMGIKIYELKKIYEQTLCKLQVNEELKKYYMEGNS